MPRTAAIGASRPAESRTAFFVPVMRCLLRDVVSVSAGLWGGAGRQAGADAAAGRPAGVLPGRCGCGAGAAGALPAPGWRVAG